MLSCGRCCVGVAWFDGNGARIVADRRVIRRLSFACVAVEGPIFLRFFLMGTVSGVEGVVLVGVVAR